MIRLYPLSQAINCTSNLEPNRRPKHLSHILNKFDLSNLFDINRIENIAGLLMRSPRSLKRG